MKPHFVEVLRTNVRRQQDARLIIDCLSSLMEQARITFDLEDVDCVLRVASTTPVDAALVILVVKSFAYNAEVMLDVVPEIVQGI